MPYTPNLAELFSESFHAARQQRLQQEAQDSMNRFRQKQLAMQARELGQRMDIHKDELGYRRHKDRVENKRWEQQFDYRQERDAVSDQFQRETIDLSREKNKLYGKQLQNQYRDNEALDALRGAQMKKLMAELDVLDQMRTGADYASGVPFTPGPVEEPRANAPAIDRVTKTVSGMGAAGRTIAGVQDFLTRKITGLFSDEPAGYQRHYDPVEKDEAGFYSAPADFISNIMKGADTQAKQQGALSSRQAQSALASMMERYFRLRSGQTRLSEETRRKELARYAMLDNRYGLGLEQSWRQAQAGGGE